MWKITLAYVSQRALLFAIALFTLNSLISPLRPEKNFRALQPFTVLNQAFLDRVEQGPDYQALKPFLSQSVSRVFSQNDNPFYWLVRSLLFLPLKPVVILLIVSNLFCLLFLWELYSVVNRFSLPDVAASSSILMVLWVTSYELSLGSSFSMVCFLFMTVLRHAMDDLWLLTGLALGALTLSDPVGITLMPVLLYLFWSSQRNDSFINVIKKTVFFLLPLGIVFFIRRNEFLSLFSHFDNSILGVVKQGNFRQLLEKVNFGQGATLAFMLTGVITSFWISGSWLHRILPIYSFLILFSFSNISDLASKAGIGAICFSGIATVSTPMILRLIQLLLILLSGYEVFAVFQ